MNFLITMAGRGQRFVDRGYADPKMLIVVRGKTLLEWSLDSLPLELCSRLVFVGLAEHERRYNMSARISALLPRTRDVRYRWLESVTRGQAETALAARPDVDESRPLVIFNIDTRFVSKTMAAALKDDSSDGVLGAFPSREPRFSFAAASPDGTVTDVREKEVISSHALTGLYSFRYCSDFFDTAAQWIRDGKRVRNEFYIAPMYADLIRKGRRFTLDHAEVVDILGTPEEVAVFAKAGMR